jgi:hypothetical protein
MEVTLLLLLLPIQKGKLPLKRAYLWMITL